MLTGIVLYQIAAAYIVSLYENSERDATLKYSKTNSPFTMPYKQKKQLGMYFR